MGTLPEDIRGTGHGTTADSRLLRLSDASEDMHATIAANRRRQREHLLSTLALCACTLCNAYLLISPFPYAGYMSMHLLPYLTPETTGTYAGVLSSSFMVGRVASSYAWGHLSDVYGRKSALLASLVLSCVCSVAFGLSDTFAVALLSRFMLGLCTCIMVITKTFVSELAHGDAELETKAMGMTVGMRGWGFLLSPAVSGVLSDPLKQHPGWKLAVFQPILSKYPYLLPNIIGAIFCLVAFAAVSIFVDETLPTEKRRSIKKVFSDGVMWMGWQFAAICAHLARLYSVRARQTVVPRKGTKSALHHQNGQRTDDNEKCRTCSVSDEAYAPPSESSLLLSSPQSPCPPTCNDAMYNSSKSPSKDECIESGLDPCSSSPKMKAKTVQIKASTIWGRTTTRHLLVFYCLWSFVVICMDEAFPLFCLSWDAGLGLSEGMIGKILSGSGVLYALFQYHVYTFTMNHLGLYGSLHVSSFLGVPIIGFVPVSLLLNRTADRGTVNWEAFLFLSILLAVCRIFSSTYFAGITIAMNRSVPDSYRGKLNGLSMMGGSFFKAIGPTFAGALVAFCFSSGIVAPHIGSIVVFAVISLLGLSVAACSYSVFGTAVPHGST